LVLSHGHYDHTGGLRAFLEINNKAAILAKEEIFTPKYSGKSRFIGLSNGDAVKSRVTYVNAVTECIKDVFIIPEIKLYHPEDTNVRNLYKKKGKSF